jgi:hypothetical protein
MRRARSGPSGRCRKPLGEKAKLPENFTRSFSLPVRRRIDEGRVLSP